jgi:hypothetical protein
VCVKMAYINIEFRIEYITTRGHVAGGCLNIAAEMGSVFPLC